VSERRFFLRPDREVEQIVGYAAAEAAQRFDIAIHLGVALSNHYHFLVTDRRGRLPGFTQRMNRHIALPINALRGRDEAVWSSDQPSCVRLEEPEDIFGKALYLLANPVSAGLVQQGRMWPGLWTPPKQVLDASGTPIRRPASYFNPNGLMPATATLRLTVPPGFEHQSRQEWVERLEQALEQREEQARNKVRKQGRRFVGVAGLLEQDWRAAPKTREVWRKRNPHIAAKRPTTRMAAIERLRTFRAEYAVALERWRGGKRRVRFPAGTYQMRVYFRVSCHHVAGPDVPDEIPDDRSRPPP